MKNVPCLAVSVLFSAIFVAEARADGTVPQPPTTEQILSLQDPDGVPLVISHPKETAPTQEEIDASKQEAEKEAQNKDWLLRSYEEQLQKRTAGDSGESNNLYYRIATDKRLSKLAGVSTLSPSLNDVNSALRSGDNSSGSALGPRPTPPPAAGVNPSFTSISIFKPLITPLGAAEAAGLHDFYVDKSSPAPAPTPNATDTSRISPDLDMPGQVGAASNPLSKDSLTFDAASDDVLPDKDGPRAHVADDVLPLSTNAQQIQKLNDAALNAPGTIKTVTPPNGSSLQLKYQEDPIPEKLTAPSPVRQPIANPYSILDR